MFKNIVLTTLLAIPLMAHSATFNTWSTNEGISGNYILNIDEQATDGVFNFNLTVNPWNAEALGLFIDFGDFDLSALTLSNIVPAGEVSIVATDTSSNSCGPGCNLNGLNPTLLNPDGEWELVFRLGEQGFDEIQTFSWTVAGLTGIDESDIGVIGIRAQQLCDPGETLPNGSCGGSDKSDFSVDPNTGSSVPEPSSFALMGLAFLAFGFLQRKRPV